jgi:hypothetical protein
MQGKINNSRTKPCMFLSNCKKKNCNYAHSIHELNVIECLFDKNGSCKNKFCKYKHNFETKEDYSIRMNFGFNVGKGGFNSVTVESLFERFDSETFSKKVYDAVDLVDIEKNMKRIPDSTPIKISDIINCIEQLATTTRDTGSQTDISIHIDCGSQTEN